MAEGVVKYVQQNVALKDRKIRTVAKLSKMLPIAL